MVPQSDSSGCLNAEAVVCILAQVGQEHRRRVCADIQSVCGVPIFHSVVQDDAIGHEGWRPGHIHLAGAYAVINKHVWRTARH